MRIGAGTILKELPQFANRKVELIADQSVSDIMAGMKKAHKDFAGDYDKICVYFLGNTVEKTCKNIFHFLRSNTNYFVESEDLQTVKSPAAILHTKNIDCKNYALFAGGVLDAINRNGLQKIDFCYRYVSNQLFNDTPNHVFICVFDNGREIWIDPIPEVLEFDYRLPFFYTIDKNFSTMSLVKISGADSQIGFVLPVGVEDVKNITSVITNLFGNRPNPNDWAGWAALDNKIGAPIGTNARSFVIKDGDSVQNEALNIVRWIENMGLQTVLGYDSWHKRNITPQDLANKLTRGGYGQEAQQFLEQSGRVLSTIRPQSGSGTAPVITNMPGQTVQAGMSKPLLIGLAGLAAYFLFFKKGR